jgi:hypothetical protein
MLALMVIAVINALPVEYVVDCSALRRGREVEVGYRYECLDGSALTNRLATDDHGDALADWLMSELKDRGWRFERVADGVFVIRGSKTSPIKSVTFKGDAWVPVVTKRLATGPLPMPPKK